LKETRSKPSRRWWNRRIRLRALRLSRVAKLDGEFLAVLGPQGRTSSLEFLT
jgi:hypothetical protein